MREWQSTIFPMYLLNVSNSDFPVQDVQWSDIDAFDGGRIFTYNKETFKGFPEFVDMLHKENKKYLLYIAADPPRYISIIDPALPDDYFASELAHSISLLSC